MTFIRRTSAFFRLIRDSLSEPILLYSEPLGEKLQHPLNRRLHRRKLELRVGEYEELSYDFKTLYTDLHRIGFADIGFLYLKNKYLIDQMCNSPEIPLEKINDIYKSFSNLDKALVDAISDSETFEVLVDSLINHYLISRSMAIAVPQINILDQIPRALLQFEFSWSRNGKRDQTILSSIHVPALLDEATYLGSSSREWFGLNLPVQPLVMSTFSERKLLTPLSRDAFKAYYLSLVEKFLQTTQLSLFEIAIILFIRIVGFHHPGQHPLPYLWNALSAYRDFISRVESSGDRRVLSQNIQSFLTTDRGKFVPLWPFLKLSREKYDNRLKLIKQFTAKFDALENTEETKRRVKNSVLFYTIPEFTFGFKSNILPWEEFKKVLWETDPIPNIDYPSLPRAPIDMRYFHPLMNETVIADNFHYILTFFKFK
jgi:hypothetical protein